MKPNFIIGNPEDPYLLRWYLIPRNRWFNIYLHKFLRDDDDRAMHDHPWWFVSIMIAGGYFEHTSDDMIARYSPSVAFRKATHKHRIELFRSPVLGRVLPCWTLVITGPKVRTWGFWCPKGFVPWFDFVDRGSAGKGCD